MFDLISIGNIAIDLYFKDRSLTFREGRFQLAVGGKYFTNYFYSGVGGGGANVAVGASHNGLKTAVLGIIGNNPFKEVIIDALRKEDVSTYLCQLVDDYINISTILLNGEGDRSIVNFESPHQHLIKNETQLMRLKQTRYVYFGNVPDVSLSERIKLLTFFKQQKIFVVANLGAKDCRRSKRQLENYLFLIDILIVNGHEFAELIKRDYRDIHFNSDVTKYYERLKDVLLIVTDGEKGSYAYSKGVRYYQKAIPIKKVVDATGAGDGFTSGFIAEYYKSQDIQKALHAGSRYAVEILRHIGAN